MAWRNSNRCIGRIFWKSLKIFDARQADTDDEIFNALQEHIDFAFNKGNIRSTITVFRQRKPDEDTGPRILNHQLIRYAGHRQANGHIIGDPAELTFTDWCRTNQIKFEGTQFDVLPHAIKWPGRTAAIRKFSLPSGMIIPITHPEYNSFSQLGLQWYGLPVISGMMLEIGGVEYTAAPFNGWYMGTEIGSRNFGDKHRYNMLQAVAEKIGLDTSSERTLWKDRALVELNRAVLFSFENSGVTISDHHDAADQFIHFEETEKKKGRDLHADWSWIVPPLSGSATEVFHRTYDNTVLTPNFFYQDPLIGDPVPEVSSGCPFHRQTKMKFA
jgi:nitric-oxide synthase